MSDSDAVEPALTFRPLTSQYWLDLEELFGSQGACNGRWCLWWRIPHAEFKKQKGERNRQARKSLVEAGQVPGILAYSQDYPVGWCAVEPRSGELYRFLKLLFSNSLFAENFVFYHVVSFTK